MSRNGFGKFLMGLGVGACIGMLATSKTGEENRKIVKDTCEDLKNRAKDVDLEEIKNGLVKQYNKFISEIQDMDADDLRELANTKLAELEIKADKLIQEAKDKSMPVIEKETKELKKKVVKTLNEIADKIDE